MSSPLDETTNSTQNEKDVTNDLQDAGNVSNRGADITVPGISEKENSEENTLALEEGDTIFDRTPTPTSLMNTDTSQKLELPVPFPLLLVRVDIYFLLGTFLTYFST